MFENQASTDFSPAIYLHWNGGADSVYAFLEAFTQYDCRKGDLPYAAARFCQIVANFFGGTTSVGLESVSNTKDLERLTPGDNGLFVFAWVKPEDGKPEYWRCRRMTENYDQGEIGNRPVKWWPDADVEREHKDALGSDYWKEDKILKDIRAKNDNHFTRD